MQDKYTSLKYNTAGNIIVSAARSSILQMVLQESDNYT